MRSLLSLLLGCLSTLTVSFGAMVWFRAPLNALGGGTLPMDTLLIPELERFAARGASAPPIIAFLGDSLALCEGIDIGGALDRRRRETGPPTRTVSFRQGGLRPIQYAAFIDEALAGRPAAVVVEINFRLLSESAYLEPGLRMRQTTRLLSPERAWEVRAALAADGVTLLDPLVYRLEAHLGMLHVADGIRELARLRLAAVGDAITVRVGQPSTYAPLSKEAGEALAYQTVLAEYVGDRHAATSALAAVHRATRAAGVPILLYVSPVNTGYLDRLGVLSHLDLPAMVEAVRIGIDADPTEWLDLHAAAPATLFRDEVGHLHAPGCMLIAERIDTALRARGL